MKKKIETGDVIKITDALMVDSFSQEELYGLLSSSSGSGSGNGSGCMNNYIWTAHKEGTEPMDEATFTRDLYRCLISAKVTYYVNIAHIAHTNSICMQVTEASLFGSVVSASPQNSSYQVTGGSSSNTARSLNGNVEVEIVIPTSFTCSDDAGLTNNYNYDIKIKCCINAILSSNDRIDVTVQFSHDAIERHYEY